MAQTHSLDLESSSSQYASISDASQTGLDLTSGDLTIEAWVNLESLTANQFIIAKDTGSGTGTTRQWSLAILSGGEVEFFYRSATSTNSFSNTDSAYITTGVWTHIAVTVDVSAASFNFYINGVLVADTPIATSATSIHDGGSEVAIGSLSGGGNYLDGLIKDVRVFSDIRTNSEIVSDMWSETVSDANLVAEWNFNNVYTDASGNGNTLTASGSPVFSTSVVFENAEVLRPNGAGDETNMDSVVGATTHWEAVDEVASDGTTSTINCNTDNNSQRDLFALENSSVGTGTINGVYVWITFEGVSAWSRTAIKTNSSVYESSNLTSPSDDVFSSQYTYYSTNPQSASAWTWSEIDALQAGATNFRHPTQQGRVTQVYVVVDYEEAVATFVPRIMFF